MMPNWVFFLNGRQVYWGQCPIGRLFFGKVTRMMLVRASIYPVDFDKSEEHPHRKKPEMRDVTNWYFKLDKFHDLLKLWVEDLEKILLLITL